MVPYEEFLQTTAPIHPALAGGPLVNLKGEHDPLRVHGGKLKGGSAQAYFAARVAAARCDWRFF